MEDRGKGFSAKGLPMEYDIHSEYIIHMPASLNAIGVVSFSKLIEDIPVAHEYQLDFGGTHGAFPFGMLVTSCMIKIMQDELIEKCNTKGVNPTFGVVNTSAYGSTYGYMSHVGYFQSIGFDIGRAVGEAHGSNTHVPITEISFPELRRKYEGIHYCDAIEEEAAKLARVLDECNAGCNDVTETEESYSQLALTYLIREMIRNSYEHSEGKSVYVCGQFLKTKRVAEIAIVDEGLGVYRTIRRFHKVANHEEALQKALLPGVSGARLNAKDEDKCANSGYGLYMASELCTLTESSQFVIASGDTMLLVKKQYRRRYSIKNFPGTAVMVNIHIDSDINFDECLSEILKTGTKLAKEAGNNPSASMASKIASLKKRLRSA